MARSVCRWLTALSAIGMLAAPRSALSCALVLPAGAAGHLDEESAIVIWDAASKTQHFIRRAAFRTEAKDFGFLVPTPATPELAEADDNAFRILAALTAPKIVSPPANRDQKKAVKAAAAAAPPVVVVATAKVAGYDAAVLEASGAEALDRWLKDHGYVSGPALVEWFRPYIAQGWKITAFKIARDPQAGDRVATGAVRMSFRAEQPFFPYREPAQPASAAGRDRLLRIYFVGDGRFFGAIGPRSAWRGETVWSGELGDATRAKLLDFVRLPKDAAPGAAWLTEFEDRSSPRSGAADLVFAPMGDRSVVTRPDVTVPAPGVSWAEIVFFGIVGLLLLGAVWLVIRLARAR